MTPNLGAKLRGKLTINQLFPFIRHANPFKGPQIPDFSLLVFHFTKIAIAWTPQRLYPQAISASPQ